MLYFSHVLVKMFQVCLLASLCLLSEGLCLRCVNELFNLLLGLQNLTGTFQFWLKFD
jgi:hypothetical protein